MLRLPALQQTFQKNGPVIMHTLPPCLYLLPDHYLISLHMTKSNTGGSEDQVKKLSASRYMHRYYSYNLDSDTFIKKYDFDSLTVYWQFTYMYTHVHTHTTRTCTHTCTHTCIQTHTCMHTTHTHTRTHAHTHTHTSTHTHSNPEMVY